MRAKRSASVLAMWLILVPALAFAQTEIRIFVGGAVTEPVKAAGAAFTRTTRNTFVYVSDTTGALQKRLASGEKSDVVVLAAPGMEALQKANLVAAGSRVDLARALIGVAVRAGAPSPDLSTPDTFKAALLKARSVSYSQSSGGWDIRHIFRGVAATHGHRGNDETQGRVPHARIGSGRRGCEGRRRARRLIHKRTAAEPRSESGRHVAGRDPAADHLCGGYSHECGKCRRGARVPPFAYRCRVACSPDESRAGAGGAIARGEPGGGLEISCPTPLH